MLDSYYKYDVRSDHLPLLYQNYFDVPYKQSSHRFRGLTDTILTQLKEHPMTLSYTSIDEYYQCAYKFYLEKILKITRSTNEDALYIGNLFHECLHRMLLAQTIPDPDAFLDEAITGYLSAIQKIPSKRERFFIAKYKEILKHWYEDTLKQQDRSDFSVYALEKEFAINRGVKLSGKVDKILTAKIGDEQYAIVIDYKSGNAEIDLNKVLYGLGMQIPFYFIFLKECLPDSYHFAGGYLQQVLPNGPFAYDPDMTIDEQYEKHFRLVGYSNPEMKVISRIDRDFDSGNSFISGMRVNKDGGFSVYTKIIKEEEFQELLRLAESNIEEAIRKIMGADFAINPKKLGTFDSCAYCPYSDLCYRDSSDYLELEKHANLDFLKETV
jgi:ATP-dependent helicase/nuclease subunit B